MKKIKVSKKLSLAKETVNRLSTTAMNNTQGGNDVTNSLAACGSCCASRCNTNWTCTP